MALMDLAMKLAGRKRPLQLESAWGDPQAAGGSWQAPVNNANYFYRKDPFNASMPLYSPMEGYQWQQDVYQDPQGRDRYRYWQAPTAAAPAAESPAPASTDPTVGLANMLRGLPMLQQTQQPSPVPGVGSPYNYMPMMPSIPNVGIESQIGGMPVQHNLPWLSTMFPSLMQYSYPYLPEPAQNLYDYELWTKPQKVRAPAPAPLYSPYWTHEGGGGEAGGLGGMGGGGDADGGGGGGWV